MVGPASSNGIHEAAAAGLRDSSRFYPRFWKATEKHLQAAEAGLAEVDRLALSQGDAGAHHAALLARAAAPSDDRGRRLEVLRAALQAAETGMAAGVGPMAALAVDLAGRLQCDPRAMLDCIVQTARTEKAPETAALDYVTTLADAAWALQKTAGGLAALDPAYAAACAVDAGDPAAFLPAVAEIRREAEQTHDATLLNYLQGLDALPAKDARSQILQSLADRAWDDPLAFIHLAQRLESTPEVHGWALQQTARLPHPPGKDWLDWWTVADPVLQDGKGLAELRSGVLGAVSGGTAMDLRTMSALVAPVVGAASPPAARSLVAGLAPHASGPDADFLALLQSVDATAPLAAGLDALGKQDSLLQVGFAMLDKAGDEPTRGRIVGSLLNLLSQHPTSNLQFLQAVAAHPAIAPERKTAVLAAGMKHLSDNPGVASIALAMAGSDTQIADKYHIARAALTQLERDALAGGDAAAIDVVQTVIRCSQMEDVKLAGCPNEGWFWTAAAEATLHLLSHPHGHETRDLAAMGTELMLQPWMPAEYQMAVGTRVLDGLVPLAEHQGDKVYIPGKVAVIRQRMQDKPDGKLATLLAGLQEIAATTPDSWHKMLVSALQEPSTDGPRIEKHDDTLVIGGVRMSGEPTAAPPEAPTVNAPVPPPVAREFDTVPLMHPEASIEWRTKYEGGVAGAYNPWTGDVEWRTKYEGGVGGAYNAWTHSLDWDTKYEGGVAGIYHPDTGQVEWQKKYEGGIYGILNPHTGEAQFDRKYEGGIAAVYDPSSSSVEWKNKYEGGVAGVYHPDTGQIEWRTKYEGGICGVSTDPDGATLSGASWGCDYDKL